MPQLPSIDTAQSVFSSGQLGYQNIQATPADFGGVTAQAVGGLGQGAAEASGQVSQAVVRQLDLQRETNANNQYANSFSPALRDIYTKYYALQGKDAVDQRGAFQDQINDLRNQQRAQLSDPVAQQMFDQVSTRRVQMELDGMSRYADAQNKVYQTQASDGMVKSFQQQAADRWNDPNAFNAALQSITIERDAHGGSIGQPVEYTNAQIQKDVSSSWIDRLRGIAAAGDAQTALGLLNNGENWVDGTGRARHTDVRSQIEPNNLAAIQSELSSHAADQIGVQYGTQATSPAPASSGSLVDAFMGQESSGGKNAKTSVDNAHGPMQIQPATFAQYAKPGENIDNAADNKAVGARILQDYSTKYNGDIAKVAVAYFSGPGNVATSGPTPWKNNTADGNGVTVQQYVQQIQARMDKAQAQAGAAAGAVSGTLPVGDTSGVPNAAQIAPQPVGLAQDPEVMKAKQDASAEQARKDAEAHVLQLTGDPAAAKRAGSVAASTVIGNTNSAIAAQQARERIASGALSQAIAGDPTSGTAPITTFAQLTANPVAYANFRQLSPTGQAAVTERLSKQNAPLTQDGLNLYYKYAGEAANDPETFLKEDLSSAYGKMPEAQIMHLIGIQSSISRKDATAASKDLNWARAKGDVDDMLKPLGLGSAVAKTDTDNMTKNSQFYGRFQEALDTYHDQNKKYPNTQDTRKIAASLLVQGSQAGTGWFGLGSSTIPAFESTDLSKFSVPVPTDQKPQLAATFQKVMGHAPTDDELTQWYTKFSLAKKAK